MKIHYHREKLQEIVNDLHILTGISLCFLDSEGNALCRRVKEGDFCSFYQKEPEHKRMCNRSDEKLLSLCKESGKYESHICPAGLYDAALPVQKNDLTVGYILMGRVRLAGVSQTLEEREYSAFYEKMPVFDEEKLSSLRSLFANILFSSAIEVEKEEPGIQIKNYIEENLHQDISISSICSLFFISKNSLYRLFRENFDTTVNEFLTRCRMEKAKELLAQTRDPVCRVCEKVGILNYTYFCRLFKKREGITPLEYRKANRR